MDKRILFFGAQYSENIPTENIISYYNFNNNVNDSVSGNNGTPTDITYVTGKSGEASRFNGSTSNIDLGSVSDFTFTDGVNDEPFSFSTFVRFQNNGVNSMIFTKADTTSNLEYIINYNGSQFNCVLYGNTSSIVIQKSYIFNPTVNVWYHLVCTYDGSASPNGIKLYLDAVEVGSPFSNGSYTSMNVTTADNIIGGYGLSSSNTLNGDLDGMAIWDKELSQLEITDIYDKQNNGQELI